MAESYIIIFVDLVDYSTNNEPIQVSFFRNFQREINHILYEEIIDGNCVLIPTGDGMIIGIKNNEGIAFINSIRVVCDLFKWSENTRYSFRIALHVGDVNTLYDVNRNKNLIGNLINDASRILSAGDSDSIIISDTFYNRYLRSKNTRIGVEYNINEKYSFYLVDEGTVVDKHNYVHNIFSILLKESNIEYGCSNKINSNYYTRIYADEYPKKENLEKEFLNRVSVCSSILFYGIYNQTVPRIIENIEINEKRKVSINILYAGDDIKSLITEYFKSNVQKLDIATKVESIQLINKWHSSHPYKEQINLKLFEYHEMPSFGASFVDINNQGNGFIHISNYLRSIVPDKTPYFEIEWKTKSMPHIYKYYHSYLNDIVIPNLTIID